MIIVHFIMRKKRYLPHEFDSRRWPGNGRLPFGQQFLYWHNHVNFQFDTPTVDFTYPVASRTRVQSSIRTKQIQIPAPPATERALGHICHFYYFIGPVLPAVAM